jgi:hypothetical protein
VYKPDAPAALQVDDGVADGMRRFGASEEEIAKQQQERGGGEPVADEAYEVHADVWENWLFFLKVQRQWVFVPVSAGMGVSSQRMSLNWSGIRSLVLLSGVKRSRWECLVDDLLVIEDTVLKAEREALKSNDE